MIRWQCLRGRFDGGLLVVLAICVIAVWPFLSRDSLPQETDAELHIFRLVELSALVRGSEWYPRWAPHFYHGYGYPIFNYYAPLTYYLGLTVELLPRLDAVDGVKAVFVLGLLLAGLGMYGFVRDNWGRQAGFIAAAAYVYAPYIQFVDPHARGVLAESFSFGIFPMALWALDRLRGSPGAWHWAAAVALVAGLILTHNLMGLLFFGWLCGWAVWQLLFDGRETAADIRPLARYLPAAALLCGLAAAAFFWLPVLLERNAVNLNTLIGRGDNFDFRTHFLSFGELLAFTRRLDWGASQPDFRFNLGVAQWLLGAGGVILLLARRVRRRAQLALFAISLAGLLLMMLPESTFIWETVPFLPFFQFPWRFLGPAAAMLAVLAGAGTAALLQIAVEVGFSAKGASWIGAAVVAIILHLALPLSQLPPWPDFGEATLWRMSQIELHGRWLGTTSTADFVPVDVSIIPERNGTVVGPLEAGLPPDWVNWAVIPERATVETKTITPLFTRYRVDSPVEFLFRLYLFDFPGWQVRVDGEAAETEIAQPEGFIVVPLTAGSHVVEVEFGSTPARTMAWAIAALAAAATGVVAFWLARTEPGHDSRESFYGQPSWPTMMAVVGVTAVGLFVLQPLGWLHLNSTDFTAVKADAAVFADFDGQIALIGYDVSATHVLPGETITLALYWKAERPIDINYQAFVHILRPDGTLAAQSDKLNPGEYPTRRWPLDKYIRDEYQLHIPNDLPPGVYRVTTGLWVQTEGWRLPVLDADGRLIGDNYELLELQVEP